MSHRCCVSTSYRGQDTPHLEAGCCGRPSEGAEGVAPKGSTLDPGQDDLEAVWQELHDAGSIEGEAALSRIEEKLKFVERGWSVTRTERDALKASVAAWQANAERSWNRAAELKTERDALKAELAWVVGKLDEDQGTDEWDEWFVRAHQLLRPRQWGYGRKETGGQVSDSMEDEQRVARDLGCESS
jgi:hypothetical protein